MTDLLWRLYIGFRVRIRLIHLHFVHFEKPDDAKTPEEMLKEIKRRLDLLT